MEVVDYKSLLAKYMQVVAYVEGINFIDECPTEPNADFVWFSTAEIAELNQLFYGFNVNQKQH